jgi:hypothetical protein
MKTGRIAFLGLLTVAGLVVLGSAPRGTAAATISVPCAMANLISAIEAANNEATNAGG